MTDQLIIEPLATLFGIESMLSGSQFALISTNTQSNGSLCNRPTDSSPGGWIFCFARPSKGLAKVQPGQKIQ
jgi:hypothetical protein